MPTSVCPRSQPDMDSSLTGVDDLPIASYTTSRDTIYSVDSMTDSFAVDWSLILGARSASCFQYGCGRALSARSGSRRSGQITDPHKPRKIPVLGTLCHRERLRFWRLLAPAISRSKPGEPPAGTRERAGSWLWDKLSWFL